MSSPEDLAKTTEDLASRQEAASLPRIHAGPSSPRALRIDEDAVRRDIREDQDDEAGGEAMHPAAEEEDGEKEQPKQSPQPPSPPPIQPTNELDADTGEGSSSPSSRDPPSILRGAEKAPPTVTTSDEIKDQTASTSSSRSSSRLSLGDDDSDEDEEPEPSLKYQRLKGSVADVLKKDSASAFALCDRFLVLGTHAGMVFVLDSEGHLVKAFRSHTASILDLSIDTANEFVAAAGMDGIVSISSLSSAEHYAFDFKRPMRTVSLEPGFGRKTTRAFVCGGMAGAVVHREKGWLGHKETVIHSGDGPIWAIRWRGNLVAWANDRGVRIYDINTRTKVGFLPAPTGQDRLDLFRPHLFWRDDRHLVVAWADQIKLATISERRSASTNSAHLHVDVTKILQLDCAISGIAPYGEDLLILAYVTESESDEESDSDSDEAPRTHARRLAEKPELRIINPQTGEEKSSDVLSLTGYERLSCNDYHLVPSFEVLRAAATSSSKTHRAKPLSSDVDLFYVVSPHDVIVARPRDTKDHVDWLLERKKYESALVAVETMGSEAARNAGFDKISIGKSYLNYLIDDLQDYERAAKVGTKILGRDVTGWEEWAFLFLDRGRIAQLVDYIPTEDPVLSNVVYDMVLAHFLNADVAKLKALVHEWPPEIYSVQAVALAMEDRLRGDDKDSQVLMETLADLYVRNRQPGKSLQYYLRLKWPGVFDLIRDNNLILDIRDQAKQLIEFENEVTPDAPPPGQAIQLLVDNVHSIPPQRVVPQLESKPLHLHRYLASLFTLDSQLVVPYSDLQVSLYARFAPEALLSYLRAMTSYYSFEEAFSVCQKHDLVPEMVFLLGRVGDNKRALNLIIERLGDVERAIDFAKEQNDDDLWEDVLRYSETRPAFIRGLLENVGGVDKIDPVKLMRRIQDGLEIPGLKEALRKILSDYQLQISLVEGCLQVMAAEAQDLAATRSSAQMRGIVVAARPAEGVKSAGSGRASGVTTCQACGEAVPQRRAVGQGSIGMGDEEAERQWISQTVVVFLCRHTYHLSCLVTVANMPLPRRGARAGNSSAASAAAAATNLTTTTQRQQRRRAGGAGQRDDGTSNQGAVDGWGPALRWAAQKEAWEEKARYAARLRVPIVRAASAKGCPTCRGGETAAAAM